MLRRRSAIQQSQSEKRVSSSNDKRKEVCRLLTHRTWCWIRRSEPTDDSTTGRRAVGREWDKNVHNKRRLLRPLLPLCQDPEGTLSVPRGRKVREVEQAHRQARVQRLRYCRSRLRERSCS